MKKLKTIAFSISLLCTYNTAMAASAPKQVGEIITQSAELVFKKHSEINFQLTPAKDLQEGKNKSDKPVAQFSITSISPVKIGIRWTPNTGDISGSLIKLHGNNNPNGILKLKLSWDQVKYSYDDKGNWYISGELQKQMRGSLTFDGDQQVSADTYTVSMDASAFIS